MQNIFFSVALLVAVNVLVISDSGAEENAVTKPTEKKVRTPGFENTQIRLRIIPRSTEQMAGFYEARGFPEAMIKKLSNYCFFTVVIKNKTRGGLELDLDKWQFSNQRQKLTRMPRSIWPPIWKSLAIPLAAQSTFRWTLLPEKLDFYAHESEGGNIILEKSTEPFSLRALFELEQGSGPVVATIDNLRCADGAGVK